MKHSTPRAATFGLIAIIAAGIILASCGDGPEKDPTASSTIDQPAGTKPEQKINPADLAKTTALRHGDTWQINVTLPRSFPDGARLKAILCESKDESHTLSAGEINPDAPIAFFINISQSSYEITLTDDKDRTYRTKATIE